MNETQQAVEQGVRAEVVKPTPEEQANAFAETAQRDAFAETAQRVGDFDVSVTDKRFLGALILNPQFIKFCSVHGMDIGDMAVLVTFSRAIFEEMKNA